MMSRGTGNINFDRVQIEQNGDHNTAIQFSQPPPGRESSLPELASQAVAIRALLAPADLRTLNDALAVLEQGENARPDALRRALDAIITVARTVGTVGVPVLGMAVNLKTLLGL